MRFAHCKPHLLSMLLVLVAIAPMACDEPADSENSIQKTLDTLLFDLQVATSSNNSDRLTAVISSTNRVRPTTQSQKQTKNLLLSCASEKLAQLQIHDLSAETAVATSIFQLAENQAIQVSRLRSIADSLAITEGSDLPTSAKIVSAQQPLKNHFDAQLTNAIAEAASHDSKSQESRDIAKIHLEDANKMFEDAENKGIVDGHSTYKSAVKKIRASHKADLEAAMIELQSHMHAIPLRDDARAELEAIASILNGMQNTENLHKNHRDISIQNAADFRELADEIDTLTAETMNSAINLASTLNKRWSSTANLLQDAMKNAGRERGASREAQRTSGLWKLELEWTLGKVEETKRSLLVEQARAVQSLIDNGIVTTSSKWQELSAAISIEIEQATITAISAYENAKQLASNVGAVGNSFIHQLDTRMTLLQGGALPVPNQNETGSTASPLSGSAGYSTPQTLVEAFNTAVNIKEFDGSTPVTDIRKFYLAGTPEAQEFIDFMNTMIQSTGNILIAIRANIGADAITLFMEANPMPSKDIMLYIDPTSIITIDENEAVARDLSGKQTFLQHTPQGWKIHIGSESSESETEAAMALTMMMQMFSPVFDGMNSVTEQINNGQITTIDQINEAMLSNIENMNPF